MKMMMKLIHAVVAALTALLLYIKQGYAFTTGMKLRNQNMHLSCEKLGTLDAPPAPAPSDGDGTSNVCAVCVRASRYSNLFTSCEQPKYKRDPDISIDNEVIGKHPCDYIN